MLAINMHVNSCPHDHSDKFHHAGRKLSTMHFQYIVGVLATIMIASGCSANILDSIKNSVSNGVNSVENALGINDAPSPAGAMHFEPPQK
jgi:hypothetical protein